MSRPSSSCNRCPRGALLRLTTTPGCHICAVFMVIDGSYYTSSQLPTPRACGGRLQFLPFAPRMALLVLGWDEFICYRKTTMSFNLQSIPLVVVLFNRGHWRKTFHSMRISVMILPVNSRDRRTIKTVTSFNLHQFSYGCWQWDLGKVVAAISSPCLCGFCSILCWVVCLFGREQKKCKQPVRLACNMAAQSMGFGLWAVHASNTWLLHCIIAYVLACLYHFVLPGRYAIQQDCCNELFSCELSNAKTQRTGDGNATNECYWPSCSRGGQEFSRSFRYGECVCVCVCVC